MQQISFVDRIFEVKKDHKKGANSERADLVGQFTDLLNSERVGTKYKKLSYSFIGIKLSHVPVEDLYFLLKRCKEGKSFGKIFFGSLKLK